MTNFLVLPILVFTVLFLYGATYLFEAQKRITTLQSAVIQAEQELLADLKSISIDELQKTKAGQVILMLLAERIKNDAPLIPIPKKNRLFFEILAITVVFSVLITSVPVAYLTITEYVPVFWVRTISVSFFFVVFVRWMISVLKEKWDNTKMIFVTSAGTGAVLSGIFLIISIEQLITIALAIISLIFLILSHMNSND